MWPYRYVCVRKSVRNGQIYGRKIHGFLHDDNAPSHRAAVVTIFKAKNATNTIDQPPYLPNLVSCDFFLFPRLKLSFRGTRFDSIEAIKQNSWENLKAIPECAYKKCFEHWEKRWHMCLASNEVYFKDDKISIDE